MKTFNPTPSVRFWKFVFFNCRTIGTNGKFIGPLWAEIAYRQCQSVNQWGGIRAIYDMKREAT